MDFKRNKYIVEYLKDLLWFLIAVKYFLVYLGFFLFLIFYPICIFIINIVCPIVIKILIKYNLISAYYGDSTYELTKISCCICLGTFCGLYCFAKIFGIFKKLNSLNFYLALLIIIIISSLLFMIAYLPLKLLIIIFILLMCYLIFKFYKLILNKNNIGKFDFKRAIVYRLLIFIFYILSGFQLFQYNGVLFHDVCVEYSYTMFFLIPAFLLYKLFGYLRKKFSFPFEKIVYFTSINFFKDTYKKLKNKNFF